MGHKTPQEGKGTVEIEKRTSKIPSGFYLAAGLTAMAASATLKCLGRKHSALFVGQWAAPHTDYGSLQQDGQNAGARLTLRPAGRERGESD